MNQEQYPPKIARRIYAQSLEEQLRQLESDEFIRRFTASRQALSADPYRPLYHYVNPEGRLNDPNGLCRWRGLYHLFYQAYPPEDPRQHWGHAVSRDLVHWMDLPLAIYPGIEEKCFSGSAYVEADRVIAMYHGTRVGNMIALASDPLLLNWEKIPGNPVIPIVARDDNGRPYRVYDPFIWKEADGYYALSGTFWDGLMFDQCRMVQHLFHSPDLARWSYQGPLVEGDVFTAPGEDGACPYFWPIGDKHILLFISHQRGAQYLIGDYDQVRRRFHPLVHGRSNFGQVAQGGVLAPSATPDGKGGVYVIYNVTGGKPTTGWNQIMSLVRVLTLRPDNTLGIEPVPAVESLRTEHRRVGQTMLPANRDVTLPGIAGNAMELAVEVDPGGTREICLDVLRSPDGQETTAVKFYRQGWMVVTRNAQQCRQDALVLDISRSSLAPDVPARAPEIAPFALQEGEPLRLRVFIDKSIVEVFANGRQCLALRVYPERPDSVGVSLRAQGGDATLRSLEAWQMLSIWHPSDGLGGLKD